jgi:hypothetical protein
MQMQMMVVAQVQDDGLTLGEFIHNIPHDGPALVIYVMIAVFIVLIWRGSREKAS